MLKTKKVTIQELKAQLANRIAEYEIPNGVGSAGTIEISLAQGVTRTFRAHWTGFRLTYQKPTIVLKASLKDGSFWSEGYFSPDQPSYVLVFRKKPHKSRGTGAERPDDKFSAAQALETSRATDRSPGRSRAGGRRGNHSLRGLRRPVRGCRRALQLHLLLRFTVRRPGLVAVRLCDRRLDSVGRPGVRRQGVAGPGQG